MSKSYVKNALHITLVLFLICAVVAGVVSLVNTLTWDTYQKNLEAQKNSALDAIFGGSGLAYEVQEDARGADALYLVLEDGTVVGYCVELSGYGYGGEIAMIIGYHADGTVRGLQVISQSETPGVGTKATSADFLENFIGKSGDVTLGEDFDAIGGATISSEAVTAIVNKATRIIVSVITGESLPDEEALKAEAVSQLFGEEAELQAVTPTPEGANALYRVIKNGVPAGYCVDITEPGYHGDMVLMIGYEPNGIIRGVQVISHHETAGYGSRVVDEDGEFLPQYPGKGGQLTLGMPGESKDIDAVVGATSSAQTVHAVINRATAMVDDILTKGGE